MYITVVLVQQYITNISIMFLPLKEIMLKKSPHVNYHFQQPNDNDPQELP